MTALTPWAPPGQARQEGEAPRRPGYGRLLLAALLSALLNLLMLLGLNRLPPPAEPPPPAAVQIDLAPLPEPPKAVPLKPEPPKPEPAPKPQPQPQPQPETPKPEAPKAEPPPKPAEKAPPSPKAEPPKPERPKPPPPRQEAPKPEAHAARLPPARPLPPPPVLHLDAAPPLDRSPDGSLSAGTSAPHAVSARERSLRDLLLGQVAAIWQPPAGLRGQGVVITFSVELRPDGMLGEPFAGDAPLDLSRAVYAWDRRPPSDPTRVLLGGLARAIHMAQPFRLPAELAPKATVPVRLDFRLDDLM